MQFYFLSDSLMIAELALPPALDWKHFNLTCHSLGTSLMPSTLLNWMQTELSCIFKIHLGSFFQETSCYIIWGFKYPISFFFFFLNTQFLIYFISKFGCSCILFLPSGHIRSKQVENILKIQGRFPITAKNWNIPSSERAKRHKLPLSSLPLNINQRPVNL